MNIKDIETLALEFREALDVVVSKKQYGRLSMFSAFPKECCRYTSDLLAEYLINNGVKRERLCMAESETIKYQYTHCWLIIDRKYCLDITADQFNDKRYFNEYKPIPFCCVKLNGTYLYELFDDKKTTYIYNIGIDTYGGDIPYKLKIVYDAVINEMRNQK